MSRLSVESPSAIRRRRIREKVGRSDNGDEIFLRLERKIIKILDNILCYGVVTVRRNRFNSDVRGPYTSRHPYEILLYRIFATTSHEISSHRFVIISDEVHYVI